ncbi:aspartate/glutamate racemase family protein [Biformimicrobium ophioploci]|uniref:Aspartate/glutamate racemase family protein n=1 Tax=Biformimicrobium ophioploci TaxID=3036711 RepID=A0ABQ6LW73_9GAMM|nr:aspartate/glutamate racemase family protein [Microbulbifer sp. NKW57]GMG86354.1 aspartate/glutamate racemase family protein [Microbulbifer sp. NKW57]
MQVIGLLGGMSWESTATYYRRVNEQVKASLGGLHSAQVALYSVDFEPIEKLQHAGDWEAAGALLVTAARRVESAGADFLLICTNTMHKLADRIEASLDIPLLHIADATAEVIREHGFTRVGLLGTAFTMEQDFYRGRLQNRFGIDVIVPGADERKLVHDVIYDELCLGRIHAASKAVYLRIIESLREQGAEAVILGCTEIGLLVRPGDTDLPLLDTVEIHAQAAVARALSR